MFASRMHGRTQSHSEELERTYADGEIIVREGDTTRDMFVIQTGQVRITKRVGESELELALLGRGDFFGEMSLLESLPRDATAYAVGQTELLVISAGALLVRMRRDPTFAFEMLHRLSGRVRSLNARLVELLSKAHHAADRASNGESDVPALMYTADKQR